MPSEHCLKPAFVHHLLQIQHIEVKMPTSWREDDIMQDDIFELIDLDFLESITIVSAVSV